MVFIDIGANVGSYSVLVSDLAKDIYAFEPSPDSYYRCRKNFALNNLKVEHVMQLALSNKKGTSGFTDLGSSSTINHLTDDINDGIKVKTDTLDNWAKKCLSVNKYDLVLKIDVEGSEERVLLGSRWLLKQKVIKYMILEIFKDQMLISDTLKKYGYYLGHISGNNYYAEKV